MLGLLFALYVLLCGCVAAAFFFGGRAFKTFAIDAAERNGAFVERVDEVEGLKAILEETLVAVRSPEDHDAGRELGELDGFIREFGGESAGND